MRHALLAGALMSGLLVGPAGAEERVDAPRCKDYIELSPREQLLFVTGFLESYLANFAVLEEIAKKLTSTPEADESFKKGVRGTFNAYAALTQLGKLGTPADAAKLLAARCYEPKRNLRRASLTLRDMMLARE